MSKIRIPLNELILIILTCYFATSLNQKCHHLVNLLRMQKATIQKQIILSQINNFQCMTKITPKYKWSQNMSHIQVKIQFITTTHTAPCDQILYQNKTVNHDMFQLKVICLHASKILINYDLYIKTFKSLDYPTAIWKRQEQNSFVLQCLKSPSPYFWPILHSRTTIPARTPKIWWQLLSLYGPQLRKVIDLLEIGDQDKQVSRLIKGKKRKQDQKKNVEFFCNQGSPQYLGSWL